MSSSYYALVEQKTLVNGEEVFFPVFGGTLHNPGYPLDSYIRRIDVWIRRRTEPLKLSLTMEKHFYTSPLRCEGKRVSLLTFLQLLNSAGNKTFTIEEFFTIFTEISPLDLEEDLEAYSVFIWMED